MTFINNKTYLTAPPQTVAFLGLGVMGYAMSGHLAKAGHVVRVFNRTAAKSQAWLQDCAAQGIDAAAFSSAVLAILACSVDACLIKT